MLPLSYGSIFTCCVFSSLLILYLVFILSREGTVLRSGTSILYIGCLVAIIRLFFPCNFSFTYDIASEKVLPAIFYIFNMEILHIPIRNIFFTATTLVAFFRLFFYFQKMYRYRKMIRRLKPVDDFNIQKILSKILAENNCKKQVEVFHIPDIGTPSIAGLIHPVIFLPRINYSDEELHYILKHEMNHYFHHDLWTGFLCEIIICVYWWNPICYLLRRQIKNISEYVNDQHLTKYMKETEKLSYMESLLRESTTKSPAVCLPTLHFQEGNLSCLEQRFHLIINPKQIRQSKAIQLLHTLVILSVLLISVLFVFEPSSIDKETQNTTFAEPTKQNTFFIKRSDQQYDMYVDQKKVGYLDSLEGFSGYKVYSNKKEAKQHETFN